MRHVMMTVAALSLLATPILVTPGLASGTHSDDHQHGGEAVAAGKPGKAAEATRSVAVDMMEMPDGSMMFEPGSLTVKAGETVRLQLTNDGELDHEFVIDTEEGIQEHKTMMQKMPDMQHDEPNALRLEPGAKGEIVWTFTTPGTLEFACLIPGHYEGGMKGMITVSQ